MRFGTDLRAENAEALHLLGVLAYRVGLQAQEALGLIDRAIAAAPENGRFYNTRGALHYALGMNTAAEAAFRRDDRLAGCDGKIQSRS